MDDVDYIIRTVQVALPDGSLVPAELRACETTEGTTMRYTVSIVANGETFSGTSDQGFFRALCDARLQLEKLGLLIRCLGGSEDVYPSPMQEDMGPALLAYRVRLGEQALLEDIVDIFDTDERVKPATVSEQERFYRKWIESLMGRRVSPK